MKTNIITDTKTVMVKLISAPVTPLAVLGVAKDMRVADFTVELKLVFIKDDHFICFAFIGCLE